MLFVCKQLSAFYFQSSWFQLKSIITVSQTIIYAILLYISAQTHVIPFSIVWAPVLGGICLRWWIPLMSKQTQWKRYTAIALHCCIQSLAANVEKKLYYLSCTEQWDILQLEAVLKQAGPLPRKSQNNIFSHVDERMHSPLAATRLSDNI